MLYWAMLYPIFFLILPQASI
uniref:Uncharacterized protein n=1 Tax=Rhizophora mucronata TaxID=61149 RepID=A0A2P2P9G3_RHIMU